MPFDVDESVVVACADELVEAYPGLTVHGVVGDFDSDLSLIPPGQHRVFAFLGGTVGNLEPDQRDAVPDRGGRADGPHRRAAAGHRPGQGPATLEAAYDDAEGLTAAFNRNVLRVINRELGGRLRPGRLRPRRRLGGGVPADRDAPARARGAVGADPALGLTAEFEAGEEIRTEVSCKFTPERVADELDAAGLRMEAFHTDSAGLFALSRASLR